MNRLAERTAVRIAIFAVIATALVWTMLPTAGYMNEFRDAQVMTLHERAAVDSVRRFGEIPLWDPWYCGGLYGLGAPQSRWASPPFLLSLLFGVERAEPLIIFLFALLGMEGAYRWIKLRVNDATPAMLVAPLFALSGHFAVAYFRGWTNFFGFELVPWVLYGITICAAKNRTAGIAISAIAFMVMLGFGGTFAAPLVAVAATVEGVRAILEQPRGRRLRAMVMLATLASFMLTAAAVRLLPIAETLAASPRLMAGTPGHPPKALLYFLVKSLETRGGDVEDAGMFFVGGAFLALVALGGSDRKSIRPLVIVVIFLWLAAGYARKPPLFALLRELPVFSALRYPERFLWIAILYACEPAANAISKLPRLGEGKQWRYGSTFVLSAAVVITIGAQVLMFADVGKARELGVVAMDGRLPAKEFHQARGNRWLVAHYDGVGAGSLSCWETHPVIMSPKLRGDLAAEEYLADPKMGTVERLSWSPNKISVKVKTNLYAASVDTKPRLLVNQNWHPGWRSSVGTVVSDDGLLAVELPASASGGAGSTGAETLVELSFKPMSALTGAMVTLASLLSMLVLAIQRRGFLFRRGVILRTVALIAVPWLVLAGFVGSWSEPKYPPPPMRNQNGTPAIVSESSADAVKIHAQFDLPVVVDAVRFEPPNALQNVGVDLWLRRTGPIPRTTGMFIHVLRRGENGEDPLEESKMEKDKEKPRDFFNSDHQVVGGSFYLSDAPEGYIIHDAFGIQVGKGARGIYDIWLGFGHVSGRRGRSKVLQVEGPNPKVNEDRVRIATFVLR